MAEMVDIGPGAEGKLRNFWVGFGLTVITIGFYRLFWFYFVNDELKDIGRAKGDENLARSSPPLSVIALVAGWFLYIPDLISVYNYGVRIRRAQRLGGVPSADQISPVVAFVLFFPGIFLVIPAIAHFWYVTKHQNLALRAAAVHPVAKSLSLLPAL